MAIINYTVGPDWQSDSKYNRTTFNAGYKFRSPMGWVGPVAGQFNPVITAISWLANVVTVTSANHGLVSGQYAMVLDVVPAGYNGFYTVTVVDANTFTYPLTTNPGASSSLTSARVSKGFEVLAAIGGLDVIGLDAATAPTFSVVSAFSALAAMVTGNVLTLTMTPSEAVFVQGSPKIAVTVGANTRQATFSQADSTGSATVGYTVLVFKYTIAATDVAIAGGITVATTTNSGWISDVLPEGKSKLATVAFAAPNTSTYSAN